MKEKVYTYVQKYSVHIVFAIAAALCVWWVYLGVQDEDPKNSAMENMDHSTMTQSSTSARSESKIADQDDAVRGFLNAAQTLAEVYRFTNRDSYAGLCEGSDSQYTLEGESGGILKYIKTVGATEVFCTTSGSSYLIEAKMPKNGRFYCIDSENEPIEQAFSREGESSCR